MRAAPVAADRQHAVAVGDDGVPGGRAAVPGGGNGRDLGRDRVRAEPEQARFAIVDADPDQHVLAGRGQHLGHRAGREVDRDEADGGGTGSTGGGRAAARAEQHQHERHHHRPL